MVTAGAFATLTQIWAQPVTLLQFALIDLKTGDVSESYWQTVQSRFKFAEGLDYFNIGLLGRQPKTYS